MRTKEITGYLIIDWKTGKHRSRQSKPDLTDLGKYERLVEFTVNVSIPEVEVSTLSVDIDVPKAQVHQAVLEALDDEDMPDWTDVVSDVLSEYDLADETIPDGQLADAVTTQSLIRIKSRPDPSRVREYTYNLIQELQGDA